jgi:hypothetical protein
MKCVSILVCAVSLGFLILAQAYIWIGRTWRTWNKPMGWHTRVSGAFVALFFVYAPVSLWRVWDEMGKIGGNKEIPDPFRPELYAYVIFWLFAPPLWFFLDYFSIASGFISDPARPADNSPQWDRDAYLKTTKDYADLASKIWGAVLLFISSWWTSSPA